jgi:hypothetical protein
MAKGPADTGRRSCIRRYLAHRRCATRQAAHARTERAADLLERWERLARAMQCLAAPAWKQRGPIRLSTTIVSS